MGSDGGKDIKISGNDAAECFETTVEIKIKTLDFQTYTLRVDKCVPVPELKEQIASVTGVLSEQQRLICRGRVLKDDHLLSAYHVEDGHTLHLIMRQPVVASSDSSLNQPAHPTSSTGHNPENRSSPSWILSAVLSSSRVARTGSGGVANNLNDRSQHPPSECLIAPGLTGPAAYNLQKKLYQTSTNSITNPLESLEPSATPDSLTTLSRYLNHLGQEFHSYGGEQGENSQNAGTHGNDGQDLDAITESLSELMLLTSQMITEQGTESLSQLASQLEGHPSVTDPLERSLFQNLGALLLELGRTITALQMSQTPPLPSLEEESFGANSLRTVEHGSGLSGGSPASGSLPRNMGIRIRTDSLLLQREPTSSQPQGQGFPLPPDGNSDQRDAAGLDPNSSTGVSQSQDVSSSHGAAATVSDEGIFLSNILHQIMPLISENIGAESSCEGANSVETQADDNQNPGASSRLWRGPESQPSSKRHRR